MNRREFLKSLLERRSPLSHHARPLGANGGRAGASRKHQKFVANMQGSVNESDGDFSTVMMRYSAYGSD